MAGRFLYRSIVVSPAPRGIFFQGPVSGALYPGTVVQIKAATEKVSGNFTFEVFNTGGDGRRPFGPIMVLCEDRLRGRDITTVYTTGDLCTVYVPLPGDELLMLVADVAGTTTDTHAIGDPYMVDEDSGLLLAPSSEEAQPFVNLETMTHQGANTLQHVMFSGY